MVATTAVDVPFALAGIRDNLHDNFAGRRLARPGHALHLLRHLHLRVPQLLLLQHQRLAGGEHAATATAAGTTASTRSTPRRPRATTRGRPSPTGSATASATSSGTTPTSTTACCARAAAAASCTAPPGSTSARCSAPWARRPGNRRPSRWRRPPRSAAQPARRSARAACRAAGDRGRPDRRGSAGRRARRACTRDLREHPAGTSPISCEKEAYMASTGKTRLTLADVGPRRQHRPRRQAGRQPLSARSGDRRRDHPGDPQHQDLPHALRRPGGAGELLLPARPGGPVRRVRRGRSRPSPSPPSRPRRSSSSSR